MPELRDEPMTGLAALLAIADQRSFTAAGAALGVTPSAVSQRLKLLEERLGARLVQRTTRSVGLTEAGERLVARLRPALADVAAALDEVGTAAGRATGTLRLNMSRIGCATFIEPVLARFLAEHPGLQVEIAVDDARADIVATGFDVGLRLGESLAADVVAVPLGGDASLAVVGAPAYFEAHGVPTSPDDLHAHDCIRFRRMPSGLVYRWDFDVAGRALEVEVSGRLVVNDSGLLVALARQGLGLAQVITETVVDDLAAGRLVRVLAELNRPFPGFHLYYPSRAQLAPKVQAFIAFMRAAWPRPRSRTGRAAGRAKPRGRA